jgi:hypothetical protein
VIELLSLINPEDLHRALQGLELLAQAAEKLMSQRPLRRRSA